MRLIDADKILQETYGVVIKDMFHMTDKVEVVSAIDIKEAPTVDAIPVEWLKQLAAYMLAEDDYMDYRFILSIIEKYGEDNNG